MALMSSILPEKSRKIDSDYKELPINDLGKDSVIYITSFET